MFNVIDKEIEELIEKNVDSYFIKKEVINMKTNKKPVGKYSLFCVEASYDGIKTTDFYFAHNVLNAVACFKRDHNDIPFNRVNAYAFEKVSDEAVFDEV